MDKRCWNNLEWLLHRLETDAISFSLFSIQVTKHISRMWRTRMKARALISIPLCYSPLVYVIFIEYCFCSLLRGLWRKETKLEMLSRVQMVIKRRLGLERLFLLTSTRRWGRSANTAAVCRERHLACHTILYTFLVSRILVTYIAFRNLT